MPSENPNRNGKEKKGWPTRMPHPPSLPTRESDGEQGSGLRLDAEMLEDLGLHVPSTGSTATETGVRKPEVTGDLLKDREAIHARDLLNRVAVRFQV